MHSITAAVLGLVSSDSRLTGDDIASAVELRRPLNRRERRALEALARSKRNAREDRNARVRAQHAR